jgi:hypothetical protein
MDSKIPTPYLVKNHFAWRAALKAAPTAFRETLKAGARQATTSANVLIGSPCPAFQTLLDSL